MKNISIALFTALSVLFFFSCSDKKTETTPTTFQIEENLSVEQYVNLGITLYNQSRYDESIEVCKKVIQLNPNNLTAYNIMCAVYSTQKNWREAIEIGERSMLIDPQLTQIYDNLYYVYTTNKDWNKAEEISKKVVLANPRHPNAQNNLNTLKATRKVIKFSKSIITSIISVLVLWLAFFIYKNKDNSSINNRSSLELILIGSSVSFLVYSLFYQFSDLIWSFNLKIPPHELIPPVRAYIFEHDGIEAYVLYSFMFVIIVSTYIITHLITGIKNKTTYLFLLSALLITSSLYLFKIGFYPPMDSVSPKGFDMLFLFGIGVTIGLCFLIDKYLKGILFWIAPVIILIPICFIAIGPISVIDYSFVLAPAMKMLDGAPLSEIYFQYDLLLSLLAAFWMKMKLDINQFQVLGQLSFYLFFIGALFFAKRFFSNQKLALLLLISLVLTRYYSIAAEPVSLFQITPLRLDLWLILLLLVNFKGAYHWIAGAFIGFLIITHKNLGLIYLISYLELIFALFSIEVIQSIYNKEFNADAFKTIFKKHITLSLKNILIIVGSILISILLFKGFIAESALIYQRLGIGMIQIAKDSFYWYVPVLFSLVFVLLLKFKDTLSTQYFNSGLLILFLAFGNSMYFFGRSHEHNILNASGALILTLFLLFDLLGQEEVVLQIAVKKEASKKNKPTAVKPETKFDLKKIAISALPILFILGTGYFYSDRISSKLKTQQKNYKNAQFIYPMENVPTPNDFATIKKLTNNSKNVYFLNYRTDFLYYYYGNYSPVGYFNPCSAWVLKDDLASFLQVLLDQNYYIVTTTLPNIADLLPKLKYNKIITENGFTVISLEKAELILPSNNKSVVHLDMNSSLGTNGIELAPIQLLENFSIEIVLKPNAVHGDNAKIINNISDVIGPRGFVIQQNGSNQNQFIFAYGGGKSFSPSAVFKLNENQWNYLAISVNKDAITIYNNGEVLYTAKPAFAIKNSDMPLTIGTPVGQTNSFSGLIKEVKISNEAISEQSLLKGWEMINGRVK